MLVWYTGTIDPTLPPTVTSLIPYSETFLQLHLSVVNGIGYINVTGTNIDPNGMLACTASSIYVSRIIISSRSQ